MERMKWVRVVVKNITKKEAILMKNIPFALWFILSGYIFNNNMINSKTSVKIQAFNTSVMTRYPESLPSRFM